MSKAKEMAAIETEKFQNMVSSIGADTLQAIATAGPEMQVQVHNQLKRLITPISRGCVCGGGRGRGTAWSEPLLPSPHHSLPSSCRFCVT